MNKTNVSGAFFKIIYRTSLLAKKFLRKKKCNAFDENEGIEIIYAINLDRQPQRWKKIIGELSQILDASGKSLVNYIRRISAVDALNFERIVKTDNVESIYTLGEQLYVDPCRVLPENLNLNEEIQMSRQEIAVALSHVEVWKKIAEGEEKYALILEDDVSFSYKFSKYVGDIWKELLDLRGNSTLFDILYLSYDEVDEGAEKTLVTENVFHLFRGVWFLSGYVLSKRGAEKLLSQLPVKGPVDLWINHQFREIDALLASKSVIEQRVDEKSQNSYSVLPVLSKIGVLNSEAPGIFKSRPLKKPLFVIGKDEGKLTSLAMALSMLGYRCCSDRDKLPERERIAIGKGAYSNFDAYVNIGCIDREIGKLTELYPDSYLIVLAQDISQEHISSLTEKWTNRNLVLNSKTVSTWKTLCEFLRLVPPASAYPDLQGRGQRKLEEHIGLQKTNNEFPYKSMQSDTSPWVLPNENNTYGVTSKLNSAKISEWTCLSVDLFDENFWIKRDDTFPGNMALFRPKNVSKPDVHPVGLTVSHENMGVREFSSAALTSKRNFLFGRFEAVLKPPKVSGIITGMFLHRDSPRQEIDIEFLGKDPTKLLVNVYYNPGGEDARFDYGYRGTPVLIDLGFDVTRDFHSYAIEWEENEIRWYVDGLMVHRRSSWEPTPIPHLPMKFHLNIWPSMSQELAGNIDVKLLPETALIQSVNINTPDEPSLEKVEKTTLSEEVCLE